MCWSGLTWPWHFISGFTSSLVHPWSTNKVRWNAWLLRLCRIFLLDGWILIPDIRRGPTRIHCLERSNESWICRSCSLRASRKRIDLQIEPEGSICNETGEFAKIIITDASQCWYLHKYNSAILPCKKSTVTTHPQQCREENHVPSHCGSSLVSLGKYCKNSVTSRDYEHLNNAIGLFAPMAACCTPSVDMAISQTYQPKVTNTMPYNFSALFDWIENSWIHPERSLSELAFCRSGFVLSVCWGDVPGVWRQPTGLFQAHKGDYAKNAKSVEKDSLKITFFVTSLLNPYF